MARGERMLILSDRDLPDGTMAIPALLAVSAVNRYLLNSSRRTSASLIVETGEAREVMHIALLLGYGASAINPYLAFESVADLALRNRLSKDVGVAKAVESYIKALCKGLLKTMSKMGISTLRSYRSAQVFEAVGLEPRGGRPLLRRHRVAHRRHRPGRDRRRGPGALPGGRRERVHRVAEPASAAAGTTATARTASATCGAPRLSTTSSAPRAPTTTVSTGSTPR